ncbi:hypothetical protein VTN77DRAFT_1728 [Rasamsonia byssochlamydoides]|uniref:uncharacterized protein n=1 Tax=Rasamsonia byssochlamydoides TaxID=89139 RepID=UPI003744AC42
MIRKRGGMAGALSTCQPGNGRRLHAGNSLGMILHRRLLEDPRLSVEEPPGVHEPNGLGSVYDNLEPRKEERY